MEYSTIQTTVKLALIATTICIILAVPVAFWLVRTQTAVRTIAFSLLSLPLILPPSVLGFYLLLLLSPNGGMGKIAHLAGFGSLAFSFPGLVVAMVFHTFPFVLNPLQTACDQLNKKSLEAAAVLGASPFDRFITIVLPQLRSAIIAGAASGCAHAFGAFGIILMVGGNIPGKTRVMATALYEYVETSRYDEAHLLAATMATGAFLFLCIIQGVGYGTGKKR